VLRVLTVRRMLNVRVLTRPGLLVVLGLLAVLTPGIAAAQEPRGYLQGLAGAAYTVESDSAYAGLGAWRLNARFHVFGEIGRLRNAIGEGLSDRLAATEAQIRASTQQKFGTEFPVEFEARVPAWYGFGGVRCAGPVFGRLSTFAEGGIGTARLDPQVHLTINGTSLDAEAAALTGIEENRQQLAALAGGGAGVAFQASKQIRIEGGYRYMRLFGDAKTNINRVHVAAGWTF
jgi:opacity protein-like surface antigen